MADPAAPPAIQTVGEAVRTAAARLTACGIEGAARDARILTAAALELTETDLILRADAAVTPEAAARLSAMIERRGLHEPVSRILGWREFYGRRFRVTPATLDPRPDSETLIDAVRLIGQSEGWHDRPIRILDVGTGTGCLLLTLLGEFPLASGVAVDVSREALAVARSNAEELGLATRAVFRLGRSLEGTCDKFDVLVSNPPYVRTSEIPALEADVRVFDPALALDGGTDGLDVYREIAARLIEVVPTGWAFFEVGADQAPAVAAVMSNAAAAQEESGLRIRIFQDLGGRDRCVAIRTRR